MFKEQPFVVILHGIARSSRHMRNLAAYLRYHGCRVLNTDYPSTQQPLQALVETVWHRLQPQLPSDQPVHFIGYSMGGLLVRAILRRYRPAQLGRVLLLATPNHGSEVADFLQNNWLYRRIYGPAGQQLITDQTAIQHLFGDIDYDCGVMSGNRCWDPFCALLLPGQHDGKVSVQSTKLQGMRDHIIVKAGHTGFPHHKEVQRQALYFLHEGKFDHPPA